jgi:hypothetical protein
MSIAIGIAKVVEDAVNWYKNTSGGALIIIYLDSQVTMLRRGIH